jgi:hypothetical protein
MKESYNERRKERAKSIASTILAHNPPKRTTTWQDFCHATEVDNRPSTASGKQTVRSIYYEHYTQRPCLFGFRHTTPAKKQTLWFTKRTDKTTQMTQNSSPWVQSHSLPPASARGLPRILEHSQYPLHDLVYSRAERRSKPAQGNNTLITLELRVGDERVVAQI